MAKKWELRISGEGEQTRKARRRTNGRYAVFHDGLRVAALSGATAETKGPGDNTTAGNNRCVEIGTYNLFTQDGDKYVTIGYALKRPGLLWLPTGHRVGILFLPGWRFLPSIGCTNPTKLAKANDDIDFVDSRKRIIAIIENLKAFLGSPRIPNATVVIE